jgi:glutamate synthase (NADPH/NADH) small chain
MGKVTGFLEIEREQPTRRSVEERVQDWFEIYQPFPEEKQREQSARCMDCGVPFCHTGCPVNNLIPDWNDLVYNDRWQSAIRRLHATNNFPEFTGRICPAPCEASCVLGIDQPAVSIKLIERSIVERAWAEGWIHPEPPEHNTGKRVAVVGSGPAGLAAAQQLRRAGHSVTVYEKNDRIGGLLRYGIPNFKLEKHILDRRLQQMRAEGVTFLTNAHVGGNVPVEALTGHYDAILLAGGAEHPRDLNIPGRELRGVHYAMEFLPQQNRRCEGDTVDPKIAISAEGKRVLIIGGGDTGADCLGTTHRQGAKSVHQFEIMPKPPETRAASTPWPLWPLQLRIEGAHEEGGIRDWSINSIKFTGDEHGNVKQLHALRVGPPPKFAPLVGSEFTLDVDLVLLAMGFLGPVKGGMIEQLGVAVDQRGNVASNADYMTSVDGIFAAGDMRRGQSLVVWAIAEGRKAAAAVDSYLATKQPTAPMLRHART